MGYVGLGWRPQAVSVPASTRTGPSNEDVLKALYGSVEKGRAVQAASIAEAQQRNVEQVARDYAPGGIYGPRVNIPAQPPVGLAPVDVQPTEPAPQALQPVDEEYEETDGDVIEDVAEGEEEGDSEFSGWGIGEYERPVGVAFTRREVQRMGDKRREKKAAIQRMKLRLKLAGHRPGMVGLTRQDRPFTRPNVAVFRRSRP